MNNNEVNNQVDSEQTQDTVLKEENKQMKRPFLPFVVLVVILVVGVFGAILGKGLHSSNSDISIEEKEPSKEKIKSTDTKEIKKETEKETDKKNTEVKEVKEEPTNNTTTVDKPANQEAPASADNPTPVENPPATPNEPEAPVVEEIEEIPGTILYLYEGEGNYIEMDGIGFEYVNFQSNILTVNVTINGDTQNYDILLGQLKKIQHLKNTIMIEQKEEYFLIHFL